MVKNILSCFALLLAISFAVHAQDRYTEHAKRYVEQYYTLAMEEQRASGIPAAITLGQGILETEAGTSELMTAANNHFGIKCKSTWQGPTYLHDDDRKNECFKKYGSAAESYKDHSDHLLTNPRYAPLFKCSKTDYAAWAVCLKRCGYATNPQYAQRLIKIIEDFKLQQYTYAALDSYMMHTFPALTDESPDQVFLSKTAPDKKEYMKDTTAATPLAAAKTAKDSTKVVKDSTKTALADSVKKSVATDSAITGIADVDPAKRMEDSMSDALRHKQEQEEINARAPVDTSKVVIVNGLKAFMAGKGESLLPYAVKYKTRYAHLLELNDLNDEPLPFDMYVYLEKKLTSGTHDKHTVKDGENLLMIAQQEGMQLKKLMALNMLAPGEEPRPGAVLELQTAPGAKKPLANLNPFKAAKTGKDMQDTSVAGKYAAADYKAPVYSSLGDSADSAAKTAEALATPPPAKHGTDASKEDYIKIDKTKPTASNAVKEIKPAERKGTATTVAKADSVKKADLASVSAPAAALPKTSPLRDDQQQPQLKKPDTEKEYKKGDKYYIVKRGDTAYSIAKRNEITVAQLLKWNDTEPQDIKAGQTLKVQE